MKTLFAAGLSLGLADRETFIRKAAEVIEDYQNNPEKAEKWAKRILQLGEEMKDNIWLQSSIESAVENTKLPDQKSIEQLTKAIARLTVEMEELRKQKPGNNV